MSKAATIVLTRDAIIDPNGHKVEIKGHVTFAKPAAPLFSIMDATEDRLILRAQIAGNVAGGIMSGRSIPIDAKDDQVKRIAEASLRLADAIIEAAK